MFVRFLSHVIIDEHCNEQYHAEEDETTVLIPSGSGNAVLGNRHDECTERCTDDRTVPTRHQVATHYRSDDVFEFLAITLLGLWLGGVLAEAQIAALTATGGLMLVGIGLPEKERLAKEMQKACGTGGTLAGVGMALKARNPKIRIGLADPFGAALYSFYTTGVLKAEGSSITEGIGQGRITANLEGAPIDDAFRIPDEEALPLIFELLEHEGL